MNTIDPAQPPHQEDFTLPEFLGCPPDEGPERLPEPPWDSLCSIIAYIEKRYPGQDPSPTDAQLKKFIQAWSTIPLDKWEEALTLFLKNSKFWGTSPNLAWVTLIFYLEPDPSPVREKIKTPEAPKTLKDIPPSRSLLLLIAHIHKQAPSLLYARIYSMILAYCWNNHSSKGSKIYPYGQVYICKAAGLPLRKTKDGRTVPGRTFDRIWAWLRTRGIINKAWNENPEAHRFAGWFVCTSLEQVGHFLNPHYTPRKKRP